MTEKGVFKLGPPALEGLFAFGIKGAWVARHVGVSEMTVSRWYRGVHGMEAKHAFLLTRLLELTIEKAKEALEKNEIPDTWRAGMEHKQRIARGWYALQSELNAAFTAENRTAEMALYEAGLKAIERAPQEPTVSGPRHSRSLGQNETRAPGQGNAGSNTFNTPLPKEMRCGEYKLT